MNEGEREYEHGVKPYFDSYGIGMGLKPVSRANVSGG